MLAPPEQRLLRHLAIFVGGWTLASAEAVCAENGESEPSILNTMQALLDQNLVFQIDGETGVLRFGMLEIIRKYALERLAESGEGASIQSQHAAWALQIAEAMDRIFAPQWHADYIDTLTREYANLRAALAWYCTEATDPEPGLRLNGSLWWFWAWRGYHGEARRWLSHCIRRSTKISLGHAKALLCAGDLFGSQGENLAGMAATDLVDASLACFRELRDEHGIAIALLTHGRIAWFQGDYHSSERYLSESLALCRSCANHWGVAWCLISLGNTLLDLDDDKQAEACFGESLACSQQWGYPEFSSWAVHNLGRVAHVQGDQQRATERYLEARDWFRDRGATQSSEMGVLGLTLASSIQESCFPMKPYIGG